MATGTGPFRRADRLLRPREFQYVTRHGRRAAVRGFVVLAVRSEAPALRGTRLGVTVSRRVGGAVVRNRVKRRIRVWFRHARGKLAPGLDLVVIARRAAAELDSSAMEAELREAAQRAGALAP